MKTLAWGKALKVFTTFKKEALMSHHSKPIVLCILDGWGYSPNHNHNAIAAAKLPTWKRLMDHFPSTLLEASAHNVGLPEGQMGNSEVGHMNIGAGRVILQDLPRIDQAIKDRTFKSIPGYKNFIQKLKQSQGACHMLGLLSPGGVHSHQSHMIAFAKDLTEEGIAIRVHGFLDGRDTPPTSGLEFVKAFLSEVEPHRSLIQIASIGGRYYGMDRDKRWDRVKKAYDAIAFGEAPVFSNPLIYIAQNYAQEIGDEFIFPTIMEDYQGINPGDGLLHMNFRADRVRQLLSAFVMPEFTAFDRRNNPDLSAIAGMTEYSEALNPYCPALFSAIDIQESLGEIVSQHHLKQLRAAETEKYAHVTFFFNGGQEKVFPGEDRLLVPSPQVATYDLKPEMSAYELTEKLIEAQHQNNYDLIVVNYANPDMVGHSGNLEASIKAVETVDDCLAQLCHLIDEKGGLLIITADHGNVEQIHDEETNQPHTAHTLNPVPFVIYGKDAQTLSLHPGQLSDIAPTVLKLMELPQPIAMTGKNLISVA
jgi:2,3-bisphosphoglycerate-independent phosphoglycerate mutase